MELVYTGNALDASGSPFKVISDEDQMGRHTAVLSIGEGADNSAVLSDLLAKGVTINSFRELVPRMNDIFIKLVTEE